MQLSLYFEARSMRLLLTTLLWVAVVACQAGSRGKTMTQESDSPSPRSDQKQSLATAEMTPQPSPPADLSKESTSGDSGVLRPFVNARLNSRLAKSLPSGTVWKIRWEKDLTGGLNPAFILQAGDRILAQGLGLWQLFSSEGKSLSVDTLARSNVVLDPANDLFYLARPDGTLAGRRLTDGHPEFILPALFGAEMERSFLARVDQRMLVVSIERAISPHSTAEPNLSILEVQDLGNPPTGDDLGFLTTAKRLASQNYQTTLLTAALNGQRIAFATPNNLYLADLSLKAQVILSAEFEPLAISLDEKGTIYLMVRSQEKVALWTVSPEGGRQTTFQMPRDMQISPIPPIVGYNHRAYIIGSDRVLAIDPNGKLAWVKGLKSPHAAAVITADDQLLVADGSELVAFDATGQRRVLHVFTGELLSTPPVLTASGEILVAAQQHLYLLSL